MRSPPKWKEVLYCRFFNTSARLSNLPYFSKLSVMVTTGTGGKPLMMEEMPSCERCPAAYICVNSSPSFSNSLKQGVMPASPPKLSIRSVKNGTSLWCWNTEWEAYWSGNQLFLLITAEMNGDCFDYAAYGFDFDTGRRITNKMILEQRGISEEEYLENLREKVKFMFDDTYIPIPEGVKTDLTYEKLLDQTLNGLDMECPMLINRFGEIETVVKIVTVAGSGWRYALATPFVYG